MDEGPSDSSKWVVTQEDVIKAVTRATKGVEHHHIYYFCEEVQGEAHLTGSTKGVKYDAYYFCEEVEGEALPQYVRFTKRNKTNVPPVFQGNIRVVVYTGMFKLLPVSLCARA